MNDSHLIWEAYATDRNQRYEIDGEEVHAGNKAYIVFCNFDYGNKQIGQKDGKIVHADIPIGVQPTFVINDVATNQPVMDQTEKNNVADTVLTMARNNKKFHKNVTLA